MKLKMMKRKFFKADADDLNDPDYLNSVKREETTEDKANLVSSIMDDEYNMMRLNYDIRHAPVLDLDFHCDLVPSSTPGRFHLFMDKEVNWLHYIPVLTAMAAAGLLEPGYVGASIAAGATFVRKPGVRKVKMIDSGDYYKAIK
jgi:hypothetical protein